MSRPRILFITKNVPYPQFAGSSQRTAVIHDALAAIGDVYLFVLGPPEVKPFLEGVGYKVIATALPNYGDSIVFQLLKAVHSGLAERIWKVLIGVRGTYAPDNGLKETLQSVLRDGNFDCIVGRYLAPTAQSGALEVAGIPIIVDIDDVDSKAVASKAASPATSWLIRFVLKSRLPAVIQQEKLLWRKISRLWFSNPADLTRADGAVGELVPNIPFSIPSRERLVHSDPSSKVLLWVGSFNHSVNLEGVDYFLEEIWGRIHHLQPLARFRIVGSHLPDSYRSKWKSMPNVDVIGYAESLDGHYAASAFSIVPLLDGAGTKIKVLESLGHMRTCVVTSHSISGYEKLLKDGDSVRVGLDLDALVMPIVELLENPNARYALEARGRELIEEYFTREAVCDAVRRSVSSLVESEAHAE